jgi:DNA-binding YbaB/EbfC family protein
LFKGIANLATMIKQAQQIGSKLQEINDQLKTKRATGSAGAGMIEAEVNGLGEVLRVRIDPQLFGQNDREMIEDLIPAAVNQAIAKSRQLHADAVKSAAGGLNMPGLDEALGELTGSGS